MVNDGHIRQVYQIVYQVIKWKVEYRSTRIVVSSKQFALLIWEQNNKIEDKGLEIAIFICLQQSKFTCLVAECK